MVFWLLSIIHSFILHKTFSCLPHLVWRALPHISQHLFISLGGIPASHVSVTVKSRTDFVFFTLFQLRSALALLSANVKSFNNSALAGGVGLNCCYSAVESKAFRLRVHDGRLLGLFLPQLLKFNLRTVPTILTAHIFCACQGSRARRERNAQHAGRADWFCLL